MIEFPTRYEATRLALRPLDGAIKRNSARPFIWAGHRIKGSGFGSGRSLLLQQDYTAALTAYGESICNRKKKRREISENWIKCICLVDQFVGTVCIVRL